MHEEFSLGCLSAKKYDKRNRERKRVTEGKAERVGTRSDSLRRFQREIKACPFEVFALLLSTY